MCSLSHYLLIAGLVGILTSGVTGSDALGWAAAGAAVLMTYLAGRRFPGRFGAASCDVPGASRQADSAAHGDGPDADSFPGRRAGRPAGGRRHDPGGARPDASRPTA